MMERGKYGEMTDSWAKVTTESPHHMSSRTSANRPLLLIWTLIKASGLMQRSKVKLWALPATRTPLYLQHRSLLINIKLLEVIAETWQFNLVSIILYVALHQRQSGTVFDAGFVVQTAASGLKNEGDIHLWILWRQWWTNLSWCSSVYGAQCFVWSHWTLGVCTTK